ncbi:MAG: MBL fold metallo-hydrolase [Bacteroidales bacterium]
MVKEFLFSGVEANSYLFYNGRGEALFIDPSFNSRSDREAIENFIEERALKPLAILITHGHFDHTLGASFLGERYGVESWIHTNEKVELQSANQIAEAYGVKLEYPLIGATNFIEGEPLLKFGEIEVETILIPGHTRGSLCYYIKEEGVLFAGDTFKGNRMGFSNLGFESMAQAIIEKILPLPQESKIFSGHGNSTTIGEIRLPSGVRHLPPK